MAMDDFNIGFLAGLDSTKSKAKLNQDIDAIKKSLKELELKAKLDPNQVKALENQLNSLKVNLSNVSFDQASLNKLVSQINNSLSGIKLQIPNLNTGNVANQAKQVGQQIGQSIAQGVQSGVAKAASTMKSFSQLTDSMKSQNALFDKNGLIDEKNTLDEIKKVYSEFGQVKITNKIFDSGELQSFKVNIEQVNGDLKETRSFMMQLNDDGTKFILPDDIVKGTEKYVQHLNAAKNITNATGEALNLQKQKLAEQEKYYSNIKQEVNTLYSLKTKLLSADELESVELERQIKSTKQRITYNNQQIDKKGLRDNSLTREINDLEVAKQKQLALSEARLQDSVNIKSQAQSQKELNATLKEQQSLSQRANKIQISTDLTKLTTDYQKFGVVSQEVENNLKKLKLAQEAVVNAKGTDTLTTEIQRYDTALDKAKSSLKELTTTQVSMNQRTSQLTSMQEWMRKNKAATKLVGNEVNKLIEECKTCDAVRFNGIKNEFKELQVQAGKAGKLGNSLFGGLVDQAKRFTQWIGVSGLVMQTVQSVRQMKDAVIDVNSAMVELRKVSDASDNEIKNYFNEAAESAKKLGSSISDVINATADFSRLGYNLKDASVLAEVATLYKNVGDGITIDEASSSIVSTMKAFGIEAENAMQIIDSFNEVGNNFAISSGEIGDALKRSASSLAVGGNSLSEAIGLITAGNTVVQDADTVGTALKSMSLRITSTSAELEAMGEDTEFACKTLSDYRDLVMGLTDNKVNIVGDSGEYKSTYEILKEISKVWDDMNSMEQSSLMKALFGVRQANIGASILENFDVAEEAMKAAEESAGSALKEQENYEKGKHICLYV